MNNNEDGVYKMPAETMSDFTLEETFRQRQVEHCIHKMSHEQLIEFCVKLHHLFIAQGKAYKRLIEWGDNIKKMRSQDTSS